jgi:hypothetical protein
MASLNGTSLFTVGLAVAFLPSLLTAESTISGVATDPSGSVVPGVRVEAVSPALIEKSGTVMSDGPGDPT